MKRLMGLIHICFKKIRIGKPMENPKIKELFEKRKDLRSKNDAKSKQELQDVEDLLGDLCSEENIQDIKEEVKGINSEEGGFNFARVAFNSRLPANGDTLPQISCEISKDFETFCFLQPVVYLDNDFI